MYLMTDLIDVIQAKGQVVSFNEEKLIVGFNCARVEEATFGSSISNSIFAFLTYSQRSQPAGVESCQCWLGITTRILELFNISV